MKENLLEIIKKKEEIERELSKLENIKDKRKLTELKKEYKKIKEKAEIAEKIFILEKEIEEIESMIKNEKDDEMKKYLEEEKEKKLGEKKELLFLFLNTESNGKGNNCILEIRAGAGGEEAALFARDLLRMYIKFCERKGFKCSITDIRESDLGGVKEAVLLIEGKGAYKMLKYESGVHRVQRIPVTEASGRIHTSTASIAVLPEVEDVEIEIKPEDIEIETKRASGPGGQHLQKTDSAVRIKHIPTGIVVQCQDERSQHRNKEKALRILKLKLYEYERQKKEKEIRELRREQIGTQDRSEKIRTYNFLQNRVTDHRIPLTIYNLEDVLDGNIDTFIEELSKKEIKESLEY
ncbi:MAG: peptide chain release factor 1 [Candidatus Hydrothermales bacterium]